MSYNDVYTIFVYLYNNDRRKLLIKIILGSCKCGFTMCKLELELLLMLTNYTTIVIVWVKSDVDKSYHNVYRIFMINYYK